MTFRYVYERQTLHSYVYIELDDRMNKQYIPIDLFNGQKPPRRLIMTFNEVNVGELRMGLNNG